ncbi:MAG: carbohydrate ABC transporter substrate-binding protein [Chloroflexi bacterium]|nr:carbohydrate ABC transporter substrate-binding protein [Chloroflexota bacterium]
MQAKSLRPAVFRLLVGMMILLVAVACAPAPTPVPTAPPPTTAPTAVPPTAAPAATATQPPAATKAPATTAPAATTAPTSAPASPTTAAASKPAAPVATAASRPNLKGELVINTWRDLSADPRVTTYYAFWQLMEQWVKNHPGVTIKYQPMLGTVTDIFGYITTNLRSKTLQDVVNQVFPSSAQLDPDLQYDLAADLAKPNPYSTNKTWKDDFPTNGVALNNVTVGDKVLMVGTTFSGDLGDTAILYNQDLLDKAGVKSLPKTWTELYDAMTKLKAAGIQPWYMPTAGNEAYIFTWYVDILSDQLFDDVIKKCDGAAGDKANGIISVMEMSWCVKKGNLNTKLPAYTTLFQEMKKWSAYWNEGYLAPPQPGDAFIQGKVAFRSIVRINMPVVENDPTVKFKWGSFYLPPLQDGGKVRRLGNPGGGSGAQYLFIPKTTQDKGKLDLALDLLQYVTSPKGNDYWCSQQNPPCFASGTPVEKVFPANPAAQDHYRGFIDPPTVGNVIRALDVNSTYGPASSTQETKVFQDYLSGTATLDQSLTAYQSMLDQLANTAIRQHPEWNADKW